MGETGLKTAIELAGVGEPPIERLTQQPLFPAEQLEALPQDPGARKLALQAPRGPGRPPGARNKATEEWREYLHQRYGSPLVGLAEIAQRTAADLAAELGCTRLEAFDRQLKALIELAPYMHGKMPVQVEVRSNLPLLILGDPSEILRGDNAVIDHEAPPDLSQLKPVEYQGVSEGDQGGLGRQDLDADGKAQSDQGDSASEPLIADQPVDQAEEPK